MKKYIVIIRKKGTSLLKQPKQIYVFEHKKRYNDVLVDGKVIAIATALRMFRNDYIFINEDNYNVVVHEVKKSSAKDLDSAMEEIGGYSD